ncbi:hypothetical protein JCM11251_005344 [Rhodosporidiobolus azoricus]
MRLSSLAFAVAGLSATAFAVPTPCHETSLVTEPRTLGSAFDSAILEAVDVEEHEGDEDAVKDRYHPKILLLRHGEKSKDGSVGLNEVGKKRAKCLRNVLGIKGKHRVGLILAEAYNPDTRKRMRPYLTVKALAADLGLKVDTDCEVDDAKCVRKKIRKYVEKGGKGEVVICWKHSMLHVIAHELGAPKTEPYPDDRFDIIWTLHKNNIIKKESEQCPGIDKPRNKKGRKDPDLEIPKHGLEDAEEEDDEEEEKSDREEQEWATEEVQQAYPVPFGGSSQIRLADLD